MGSIPNGFGGAPGLFFPKLVELLSNKTTKSPGLPLVEQKKLLAGRFRLIQGGACGKLRLSSQPPRASPQVTRVPCPASLHLADLRPTSLQRFFRQLRVQRTTPLDPGRPARRAVLGLPVYVRGMYTAWTPSTNATRPAPRATGQLNIPWWQPPTS